MANWAQNWVNFSGEETQINKVNAMFKAMEKQGDLTNEGQIPSFMTKPKEDYFFDIYEDNSGTISYRTKWKPNTLDLVEIANHFNLNFECTYQELGNNFFGKAIFTAGNSEAKCYNLDNTDFKLYSFDQKGDFYLFKSKTFESEEDILMDIFKEKFNFDY